MTTTRTVSFAEFRGFLKHLGYSAKKTERAWVLHHPSEGLLVFRLYGDEETVDEGDLRSTRRFLDRRGLLEATDFDSFVEEANTPA